MIHQRTKDYLFTITKIISALLYPFYRIKFINSKNLKVQLGSGHKTLAGWINIDGNPTVSKALYYDIRNKLPFPNESVNILFASNVLEHFYPDELEKILLEIYRVTANNSVIRIIVPSLEKSIIAYTNDDSKFFGDYPRSYKSIGGRFVNLIFTDAQHKIAFDFGFMSELLVKAGFNESEIRLSSFGDSKIPLHIYDAVKPLEEHFKNSCLFVEIIKSNNQN
jgi:predicted SAM-dependent methyltransferase